MILATRDLTAHYGDFRALSGVSIEVGARQTVAIIGANGAGKTTLLRSISGILRNAPEAVTFKGQNIGALPADAVTKLGIAMVPEGRKLFASLSVEENLLIGGDASARRGKWALSEVYRLFPILREFRRRPATALSGGQQQMVAIGRALMSNAELILFDEISLGLAPVVIKDIYAALPEILSAGTAAIIVEQDIGQALKVADHVYCMIEGRVTLSGRPADLNRDDIHAAYFGVSA